MPASNISRQDLLELLASTGVTLPNTTKLPNEEINKRVLQALDAAQQYNTLFESTCFVPSEYPLWSAELPLLRAVTRMGAAEVFSTRRLDEPTGVTTEKKYTFHEMRQIVMGFAHTFEATGLKDLCLMDTSKTWGIYVRVSCYENINAS